MKRQKQIARQLRQERKAQQNFVKGLTGKRAGQIAKAQSRTEYQPIIRSIRGEARGSAKREKNIGDWYNQLAGQTTQNIATSQQTAANANAAIDKRLADSRAGDQEALSKLATTDAATAKLLGGPTNSAGLAQMAQGNSARNQQEIALTAPTTAQAANYTNYLGQRASSVKERGIEARGNESSRRKKIREDLRSAQKQKGAATVTHMQELRKGERDYQTALRAFPLEKQKLKSEAANTAFDNRISAQNAATSARNANTSEYSAHHQNSNKPTRSEQRVERNEKTEKQRTHKNATSSAWTLYEAGNDGKPWESWAALTKAVQKEEGVDPVAAKAAVARLKKKVEAKQTSSAVGKAGPHF